MQEFSRPAELPRHVDAKWLEKRLRISASEAVAVGARLAEQDAGWSGVDGTLAFAEKFIAAYALDPGIGSECRKFLGRGSPQIFSLPEHPELGVPDPGKSARKSFGHFTACGRAAAASGAHGLAAECVMLELLEFGGKAKPAFRFARDMQQARQYEELLRTARGVQTRAYFLSLRAEGLDPFEAIVEARVRVDLGYSCGRLEKAVLEISESEDVMASLFRAAKALANTARICAACEDISCSPLGTGSSIGMLRESVNSAAALADRSADTELAGQVQRARAAVDGCKAKLVGRSTAIKLRDSARAARVKANEVGLIARAGAGPHQAQNLNQEAGKIAAEVCRMVAACAAEISGTAQEEPEHRGTRLFLKISELFGGARHEAKKTQDAAALAGVRLPPPAKAAGVSAQSAGVAKESGPAVKDHAARALVDARRELLERLRRFANKRWDTDVAVHTLSRLVDRRKEIIGQLWEAVESNSPEAEKLVRKFAGSYRNIMDARRRLDAVVRLMGRGKSLDLRTAKWFVGEILEIAKAAEKMAEAAVAKDGASVAKHAATKGAVGKDGASAAKHAATKGAVGKDGASAAKRAATKGTVGKDGASAAKRAATKGVAGKDGASAAKHAATKGVVGKDGASAAKHAATKGAVGKDGVSAANRAATKGAAGKGKKN